MANKADQGLLIVLDGGEGCGKSTQSRHLAESFIQAGYGVVETLQPGGTKTGQVIRGLLFGPESEDLDPMTEAFLFSADRSWHIYAVIKPALAAGKIVVCDRWASSTWAYQGYAGGLGAGVVEQQTELATNGLEPDLLIVLDIDPEIGFRRKKGHLDRIERKSLEYHQTVRNGFLDYAAHHPMFADVIYVQDRSREEVHAEIIALIKDHLDLDLPILDI